MEYKQNVRPTRLLQRTEKLRFPAAEQQPVGRTKGDELEVQIGQEQNIARAGVMLAGLAFERLGFLFREQPVHDYGIDAHVELVEEGRPTGRLFALQIKSGPSYFQETVADGFVARPKDNHIKYWLQHSLPVVLLLCDTERSIVYWESLVSG